MPVLAPKFSSTDEVIEVRRLPLICPCLLMPRYVAVSLFDECGYVLLQRESEWAESLVQHCQDPTALTARDMYGPISSSKFHPPPQK